MLWSSKILVPANQRPLSPLAARHTLWRPPAHPPMPPATDGDDTPTSTSHDLSHLRPALVSRRQSTATRRARSPQPRNARKPVVERPGADHGPNNAQDASQSRSSDGPPPRPRPSSGACL